MLYIYRRLSFTTSLFITLLLLQQALAWAAEGQIIVSHNESLADQPVSIQVEELQPGQQIELRAEMADPSGTKWNSWGLYQANEQGHVSLDTQAPLQGSYETIDGMGLFWSMKASSGSRHPPVADKDAMEVNLFLNIDGETVSSTTIHRLKKESSVRRISIREDGLVGTLFVPSSPEPLPVVIVLRGSNGGINENLSQLLASHGFAVFALGYFGVEGLPRMLEEIPFEYFEKAMAWLQARFDVDGKRIGIYGVSRGGELALLLGSFFPESIHGIVAVAPSSVIYGGISDHPVTAWMYHGNPIGPEAPMESSPQDPMAGRYANHPIVLTPDFLKGMNEEHEAFAAAAIPVERIQCPLLLLSGGDDQMWPSAIYSKQIIERLERFGSTISCEHLHYPKAGHRISQPFVPAPPPAYYHPVCRCWFSLGGSPKEDELASRDSWPKVIQFFEEGLR